MISLGKTFKKYTGTLRRLKAVYVINNLLNGNRLQHNKELYKQFGLQRSIFSPIGSHTFKQKSKDIPWLDRPNAKSAMKAHPDFQQFSPAIQAELERFIEEGYMLLKGFFSADQVDQLNAEIDQKISSGALDFNYTGRKIMESYKHSDLVDQQFFKNQALLNLLNFVMGKPVIPFHTINFIEGSEQRAHSDFIHMTTEPLGYLIAAWTALEDCDDNNGPLVYYPYSHRLPYVNCLDYPSGNSKWMIGAESNKRYEDHVELMLEESGLEKKYFHAKKGDVFVWHANLVHGGSAIKKPGATRKSMVAHYFCEGVICYHEISQRPAFLELEQS